MSYQKTIYNLARELYKVTKLHNDIISTAESCTGGMVAEAITAISGSSEYFDRAFITYTNKAKHEMLEVKNETLETFGAVSKETVKEMVTGALNHSDATIAVSISGIAGPTGGSEDKVVGTVCFAFAKKGTSPVANTLIFRGNRKKVREQATIEALKGLIALCLNKDLKNYK